MFSKKASRTTLPMKTQFTRYVYTGRHKTKDIQPEESRLPLTDRLFIRLQTHTI